ncbi:ATP-binding protein [Cupriavidus basilensis]|uniref:ATP-binding protein n=1 Tax=Cupriavidus basilensis TaxID=68895 RepID=UPI0039F6E1FF
MGLEIYRPVAAEGTARTITPGISAFMLVLSVWLGFALWAGWDRGSELRRIQADADRLAYTLGQHVERTLMEADQLTSLLGGAVIERGLDLPLAEWTRNGHLGAEPFLQTAILDESGVLRASTNPTFEALDLGDSEHSRMHADNPRPTLLVSKPLRGRSSGRWVVLLSKGIVGPTGRFMGVVVVSLDPLSLTSIYKSIYLGSRGAIGLLGTSDFIYRVRWSGAASDPGQPLPASSAARRAVAAAAHAEVVEKSPLDDVERIYGVHRLSRGNLAVVIGYDLHEALSMYRARLLLVACIASFLSALIIFVQMRQAKSIERMAKLADRAAVVSRRLRERNQHLHALFFALPDGVAIFDKDRHVEDANGGLCDALGVSPGDLRGATPQRFVDLLYRGRRPTRDSVTPSELLAKIDCAAVSHEFSGVIEFDIADSSSYATRIVHTSDGAGCVVAVWDVSEMRREERAQSHFIATAEAEIKIPIANVVGYADLLAADLIPPEKRLGIYRTIRSQAQRVSQFVSNHLQLMRLETLGASEMTFHRVDLARLVRDVVEAGFADDSRVTLESEREPVCVMGDAASLASVIRHLLENAVKYGLGREVNISVASASVERRNAMLKVTDRGMGIKVDELRLVFDKFFRGKLQHGSAGDGLGLALVREIVLLHRGHISLESEVGKGTTVTLHLPAVE